MKLYILRHGEAEFSLTSDFQRQLTPQGRTQVSAVIQANKAQLLDVATIIVSPLVRAQQTADIVVGELGARGRVTASWLTPDAAVPSAINALAELHEQQPEAIVLLVSHLPLVADLVDCLCGNPTGESRFATASMGLLESDIIAAGCAQLCWIKHVQ